MMLQAIPVLHFFSSHKEVFYAYIDEEKPDHKSKVKKEVKEYLTQSLFPAFEKEMKTSFPPIVLHRYSSPFLEYLTPPPDAV